jgi:hypothetical protein
MISKKKDSSYVSKLKGIKKAQEEIKDLSMFMYWEN